MNDGMRELDDGMGIRVGTIYIYFVFLSEASFSEALVAVLAAAERR